MVRRRREPLEAVWPLWLRVFEPTDWPGNDRVEQAWAWREAALAFADTDRSQYLAVIGRVHAERDTHRVRSESGRTYADWKNKLEETR